MEFKIFTRINKYLNTLFILCFPLGIFSILWTVSGAPGWWITVTIVLIVVGFSVLILNWLLTRINLIYVNMSEIVLVEIHSSNRMEDIKAKDDVEYHGNLIFLTDKSKIEVHSIHVIKLLDKLDKGKFTVLYKGQKWHNISPSQIFRGLVTMGP